MSVGLTDQDAVHTANEETKGPLTGKKVRLANPSKKHGVTAEPCGEKRMSSAPSDSLTEIRGRLQSLPVSTTS